MNIPKPILFSCLLLLGLSYTSNAKAVTLKDIESISAKLIKVNKLPFKPGVQLYTKTPIAAVHIPKSGSGTLLINPRALNYFTRNDWAFIIGHELAHLESRKGGFRRAESKADVLGMRFAIKSGYDPIKYLGGILARPDG